MNKQRRKEIRAIKSKLEAIKDNVKYLQDQEHDYLDDMPENLQESELYTIGEDAVYNLDCALSNLSNAIDNLKESTN